jgi:hypothetical protein
MTSVSATLSVSFDLLWKQYRTALEETLKYVGRISGLIHEIWRIEERRMEGEKRKIQDVRTYV